MTRPEDPQDRLRSNKSQRRATTCQPIGDFIPLYSDMSRDPIKPHTKLVLFCHVYLGFIEVVTYVQVCIVHASYEIYPYKCFPLLNVNHTYNTDLM